MSTPPQQRAQRPRAARLLVVAGSAAAHLLILFAWLAGQTDAPRSREPEPMRVQLVQLTPPAEPSPPKFEPEPAQPPPPRQIFRPTPRPVPPDVVPLPAGDGPAAEGTAEMSDAELASATTAGSGAAGGACDMPQRLQAALRKDRMVQAAVAEAHRGKALMVWNGDWVRHAGQEGGGLAAVREAITWEVGFAPAACRAQPMRGLVLISLADGPGSARLVVGSDQWRWSDLLFARSGGVRR